MRIDRITARGPITPARGGFPRDSWWRVLLSFVTLLAVAGGAAQAGTVHCIQVCFPRGCNFGTAVCIDAERQLYLTAAHVVGRGHESIKLYDHDNQPQAALHVATDQRGRDIALLRCPGGDGQEFEIGTVPPAGTQVRLIGYGGSTGSPYQYTGEVLRVQYPEEPWLFKVSTEVRPGDSGGAVVKHGVVHGMLVRATDQAGRGGDAYSIAVRGDVLRQFVSESVGLPDSAPPPPDPPKETPPKTRVPPRVQVPAPKQDEEARPQEPGTGTPESHPPRSQGESDGGRQGIALESDETTGRSLPPVAPLVPSILTRVAPLLPWTLGPAGGAAAAVGGILLRRWWRRRSRPKRVRVDDDSNAVPSVPSKSYGPPRPASQSYVGFEDPMYREAVQWAHREHVQRYPGALPTIKAIESLIDQYLTSFGRNTLKEPAA